MSKTSHVVEVQVGAPSYVGWRSLLLAELALARVPQLSVHRPGPESDYPFLVAGPAGLCFFVLVEGFSSHHQAIHAPAEAEELVCHMDAPRLATARRSPTPVVLFLIDADTEHGRYLWLNGGGRKGASASVLRFPREHSLDCAGLQRLITMLAGSAKAAS